MKTITKASIMVLPKTPCAALSLSVQINTKNRPRLGSTERDNALDRSPLRFRYLIKSINRKSLANAKYIITKEIAGSSAPNRYPCHCLFIFFCMRNCYLIKVPRFNTFKFFVVGQINMYWHNRDITLIKPVFIGVSGIGLLI